MRILFMGTPDYAATALKALIRAGHEIVAVVTQPDKARGRSRELIPPPVKVCALEQGIPVLQPRRVKEETCVEELKRYPAEVYVVAAFGQILSQEILDIPRYGCLNIHASLLPIYRGASPIQHAILDGQETTGITIMQMDAGIDTGDILYQKEIPIAPEDDYALLQDKLALLGGQAVVEALELLGQGGLEPRKQDAAGSSYASLIRKEMGEVDFSGDARAIDRLIRGMTPWPSAYTSYRGKQLKIWKAEPVETCGDALKRPGEILKVEKDAVTVAAGAGALRILELQLEGKKRMTAREFLLGVKMQPGEILGEGRE